MKPQPDPEGGEMRAALRAAAGPLWAVALFSVFVNLLMLTGPIFMLQIYDRVLASRSEETLGALLLLVAFLYLIMALLDYCRGRIAARVGARIQGALEERAFSAALARLALMPGDETPKDAQGDLEAVQRFVASPALLALIDIPWAPLFVGVLFLFHPWLGLLALGGTLVLLGLALASAWLARGQAARAEAAAEQAERRMARLRLGAEALRGLGMEAWAFRSWFPSRRENLRSTVAATDKAQLFAAVSRSFRLFLQSAMLAAGALLVLRGQLTAGTMIAASILLGRALAPVEMAMAQWPLLRRAQTGWARLTWLLQAEPAVAEQQTIAPVRSAHLAINDLAVLPPGRRGPLLRVGSLDLEPGRALAVIGPSGAGKSALARAIAGIWPPAGGSVLLDGIACQRLARAAGEARIGYLPQRVELFVGTVAENIARFDSANDAQLVAAAKLAGAHEAILALPDAYLTRVGEGREPMSVGQLQRIGLARAAYGAPLLLVLDEPEAHLDNAGLAALNGLIRHWRAEGRAVVVMAHRPSAIRECDLVMTLENGVRTAFGPRDEVLRRMVRNHADALRDGSGTHPVRSASSAGDRTGCHSSEPHRGAGRGAGANSGRAGAAVAARPSAAGRRG